MFPEVESVKMYRLVVVVALVAACWAEMKSYEGYKVLRITPKTEFQLKVLNSIKESATGEMLDFWVEPSFVDRDVDIMVPPTLQRELPKILNRHKIQFIDWIDDVQTRIDHEREETSTNAWGLTKYNTYEEIQQWIQDMANSYSSFASKVSLGTSFEGRDIGYLRLSKGGTGKNAFVFHGGIHAREWISPATVIYMTDLLLKDSDTTYLDNLDIYIIPVLNVDGYFHTWSKDRMWRKNRNTNGGGCTGVDLNRNWAKGFGGSGSSGAKCSDTYRGLSAISEPETKALDALLKSLGSRLKGYIDFHAYSQMWLTPWGYAYNTPPDYSAQYAVAQDCANAIRGVSNTRYLYGNTASVIYIASGVTQDYTYASEYLNVLHSYSVELRDTGSYGFILPADQIDDSGIETYEALKVVMDAVRNA